VRDRSSAKAVVRNYYGFQLFFSLLVWLPIFYEYQKHFGLSDGEIFAIQSLYYLAFCLLEIPTGLVADLWGYRRCLQAGAVALALTHLLPIFDPSYSGFLLHFMGIAVARSLISGASSAYLYEHLKLEGLSDEFRKIEGRSRAYALIAKVFAWAAVGSLMSWHVTSPYWLTFVAALISAVYAWRLPNSPRLIVATETVKDLVPVIGRRLVHSLGLLWRSPYLLFLTLQGIAIFILGRIVQVNLFQPILLSKDIALPLHGMIMAAMTVFEAIGSAYPHSLRKYLHDRNAVFVLTALLGAALILIPSAGLVLAVVILCLFALWGGLAYPIQRQLFNDAIPDSSYRATLMSMESIIDRAACAWVASLLAAVMTKEDGLNSFLLASGAITLLGTLLLWIVFSFRKKSFQ
jgi:MFS family permease